MRDSLESLSTLAGEQLGAEQLVAASPFAAQGFIKIEGLKTSRAMRGVPSLGALGKPRSNAIAGEALPDNLILALSGTRLFIFELSTKIARASELKAVVPLSAITDVKTQQYKQFPMVKMLTLDISLDDDSQLALEIGWPALKDGARFVDTLASAVAIREE